MSTKTKTSKKQKNFLSKQDRQWFDDYFAYTNYIGAASLYLKDNYLLERPLQKDDIKERILGHWGTVPGLNFIYSHVNYLVSKTKQKAIFITGPGHGAPAVLANLFAEGTLADYYKQYSRDLKGMGNLIKDFSWPHKFPSHVTPDVPGSILEGGELGYSLATAFGAAMDNPDLLVVAVIGDGEAETGALAGAWQSNKFLNPIESGAVLPILHDNGYKISGPTIYSTMNDQELKDLFGGYGYKTYLVEGPEEKLHDLMAEKMALAYEDIKKIQKEAREKGKVMKVKWPLIVCRTMKGWTGTEWLKGKKVEDNFRSHGVPLGAPKTDPEHFSALKYWLESYHVKSLVDGKGRPKKELLKYVPTGNLRVGKVKNTYGGEIIKDLKLPAVEKYEFKGKRGEMLGRSTEITAEWLHDVIAKNMETFRYFCPDETESNKMGKIFKAGGRQYMWPVKEDDECITMSGRVTEMLSETTLQGFLQGYLLTGRHGMFATYEAFGMINASMVDQHAKFLKQSMRIKWRKPIASLNYLMTSVTWRQEHNGYSHQNPSFVANILEKHGDFCSAYFPADGNSFTVILDECFKSRNKVNMITVDKQMNPQWLTVKEAQKQLKDGLMVWDFLSNVKGNAEPDLVFAAAGDYMIEELAAAVKILNQEMPELKIRVVYVSEMTSKGFGTAKNPVNGENAEIFAKYFTKDKPVVFNFHGYVNTIKPFFFKLNNADRVSLHGYQEEGSTTTPFDMQVRNETDRFHLLIDGLQKAVLENAVMKKKFGAKAKKIQQKYQKLLNKHHKFVVENGFDIPEITGNVL